MNAWIKMVWSRVQVKMCLTQFSIYLFRKPSDISFVIHVLKCISRYFKKSKDSFRIWYCRNWSSEECFDSGYICWFLEIHNLDRLHNLIKHLHHPRTDTMINRGQYNSYKYTCIENSIVIENDNSSKTINYQVRIDPWHIWFTNLEIISSYERHLHMIGLPKSSVSAIISNLFVIDLSDYQYKIMYLSLRIRKTANDKCPDTT